jgi:hypothetical protein
MAKKTKRCLFAAVCAVWAVCGAQTALSAQITESDIELVSWKLESSTGHETFSLFTLTRSAAERNPRLHNFINELLYEGQTALAYLKTRLKSFLQFNLEMLEEKDLSWNEEADPSDQWYYIMAGFYEESFSWDIRGKYLLLTREYYYGGGSSQLEIESYIVDTVLLKRLFADDIIADSGDSGFQKLVWNRLSQAENFIDWIAFDEDIAQSLARYQDFFYQSLAERDYVLFFNESGIVFYWNEGSTPAAYAAGAFEAVFSRSEIEPYLTAAGREIIK